LILYPIDAYILPFVGAVFLLLLTSIDSRSFLSVSSAAFRAFSSSLRCCSSFCFNCKAARSTKGIFGTFSDAADDEISPVLSSGGSAGRSGMRDTLRYTAGRILLSLSICTSLSCPTYVGGSKSLSRSNRTKRYSFSFEGT
jgi:hypothetical protein